MTNNNELAGAASKRDTGLAERNLVCLNELEGLLEAIDDATYRERNPLVDGSMGTHVRHLLEFYENFVSQWRSGTICYVDRERCVNLESSIEAARQRTANTRLALADVPPGKLLRVKHFGGAISQSCTTRELSYLLDHTVHHLALINVLARLADVRLPEQFGFSASTVAHKAAG